MNDPGSWCCVGTLFVILPIIALVLASKAQGAVSELKAEIDKLRKEIEGLRGTQERQAKGLRAFEKRMGEIAAVASPLPTAAQVSPQEQRGAEPAESSPPFVPISEPSEPVAELEAFAPLITIPGITGISPHAPPAQVEPAIASLHTSPDAPAEASSLLLFGEELVGTINPPEELSSQSLQSEQQAEDAEVLTPAPPVAPVPPAVATVPQAKLTHHAFASTPLPEGGEPSSIGPPAAESLKEPAAGKAAAGFRYKEYAASKVKQPTKIFKGLPAPTDLPPPTPPPTPPENVPPAKVSWERRLGIALPVWIGAVALALAGAYLVKYTIEHSLISPQMRVVLGILLGLGLLVAGEWLRAKAKMTAQGASASGIAVLYAAFLAAAILYKPPMISPIAGFVLIGLVTAAAVALSLRQGMVVAFVGLVGGFFTPYWIGAVSASPARLFTYMLLLQGGLLVVTKKRQWTGLSALTLLMGLSSAFHRLAGPMAAQDAPFIGLFLVISAGAFVWAGKAWEDRVTGEEEQQWQLPTRMILGYGSLLGAFLALAILAIRTRFGLLEWAFLGVLSIASLVLGRLDSTYSRLPWVALVLTGTLLGGWVFASKAAERPSMWLVAAGFGVLWGAGGWMCHHRSSSPGVWASLSALGALYAFGAAYAGDYIHGKSFTHWGLTSLALAAIFLIAAIYAAVPARRAACGEAPLAAFCVAVTSFVTMAVPIELERQWLSVAWAMEAAALAWLLSKLRVRVLGYLGILLASGVAMRLLLNPGILYYSVGTTPVWNWILYGYGLPALAFGLSAFWFEKSGWERTGKYMWWGFGALVFYLATLEVRQGFHPGKLVGPEPRLLELATYSHAWMILAITFFWAHRKWANAVFGRLALLLTALSLLKLALFELSTANPLVTPFDLGGWPVLNWLIYIYALPVGTFAVAARLMGRSQWAPAAHICVWFSALLGFVFLGLEVRQGFHPGAVIGPRPSLVEWATYSLLWVAAGLLLLLAQRVRQMEVLGQIGLAFLAISAAKIIYVELLYANPLLQPADLGHWPVINWLLYIYALPMVLYALSAKMTKRAGWDLPASASAWFSALLAFAFLSLEVRHGFHPSGPMAAVPSLVEWATYSNLWLLAGLLLMGADIVWKRPILKKVGALFVAVSAVKIVLIEIAAVNPLWVPADLGRTPVLNWLLYTYGAPFVLFGLLAWIFSKSDDGKASSASAWFSALLAFAFLSLEVRHGFHPSGPISSTPSPLELATYSHSWLIGGLVLMWAYSMWNKAILKSLSIAFFSISAVKIIVVDLFVANPMWVQSDMGPLPVLNWLIYTHGFPMAVFALLAWIFAESEDEGSSRTAGWFAAVLAFAFLLFEVRQGFHPSGLVGPYPSLVELATYSHVWMLAGLVLFLAFRRWRADILFQTGSAFAAVAFSKVALLDLFVMNPLWNHSPVGAWPFLNWLLYIYGVPILGLWALKAMLPGLTTNAAVSAKLSHGLLLALVFCLVSCEVRQFFNPVFLDSRQYSLLEVATYGHAWLFLVASLVLAWVRSGNSMNLKAAKWLLFLTVGKILLLDLLIFNPLSSREDMGGWPLLNGLLYVYAIPVALFWLTDRLTDDVSWKRFSHPLAAYGSLLLGLVLLTMEVRQFFHPNFLGVGPMSNLENYSYSASWIAFALCLLGAGIASKGKFARISSLVVMLLAVVKVFLYDLRHLHDLYRVMSLLGLGLSLLFISYLFSRFVLKEGRDE